MELKVKWEFTKKINYSQSNIGWNNFDAYPEKGKAHVFKPEKNWQGLYVFLYFKNNDDKIIATTDNSLKGAKIIDEKFEKFYVKKRGTIDAIEISDDFKIAKYKTWSCGKTSDWIDYK